MTSQTLPTIDDIRAAATRMAYQSAHLDPLGRTIRFSVRKQF